MSYKKCPSGKTLVKPYKTKSGKKTRSFCRSKPKSKPKYKSSRTKKTVKKKKVKSTTPKKSKKVKPAKTIKPAKIVEPERVYSRPRSKPSKSRKISKGKTVKEKLRYFKRRLEEITGVKVLSEEDIQKILKQYGDKVKTCLSGGFELKKYIGSGENGSVYLICKSKADEDENCRIIKIQQIHNERFIQNEIDMQKAFYARKLAPKIHNTCRFNKGKTKYIIIEMDPIVGTLESLLHKESNDDFLRSIMAWIINVMEKLCDNKLTHGDFHWRNIGYNVRPDGELDPVLIDFSWSSSKTCYPRLELIQLLRTISLSKMHPKNEKYLEDNIYEIYTTEFNKKLAKNIKAYDKEYDKLMDEYEKKL